MNQAPPGYYPPGSVPPQPQHGGVNPVQNVNVTMAAPGPTVIMAPLRPNNYIVLACFVVWCINPIFGLIAFALSLASSSAADGNDMDQARKLGRASMWVSVAGIIIGVVLIIVVVVLLVVVVDSVGDAIDDANDIMNNNNNWNWEGQQ